MNRWKILSLFLFVLLFKNVNADKIEKGFERLKAFDYFNAKEYFEKTLEDEPAAAAYGLSSIFSFEKNPFYNVDSARKYILICDSAYKLVKEKTKKKYNELGVNDSSIIKLSEFICIDAFKTFKNINSVAAYNHFLNYFNSCSQDSEAITLRNAAAYNDARFSNTSDAFKEFMALYPASIQYNDARSKFEELVFKENTSDNTIESYEKFLVNYPENPFTADAEKMIYALSISDSSLAQYVTYVRKYKKTKYTGDAWHEIYKLGMTDFTEETYNNFKIKYPDYPFPEELETDFRLQNYFFLPVDSSGKLGFINEEGLEMIKPSYDDASLFSEGLAAVMKNSKYGFINKAGKVIIKYQFQDAEGFHNGAAIVKKDSLYGLINKNGEFIISPKYEELSEAADNIYMGVRNDHSGYIRKDGSLITELVFDLAGDFKNGFAIVNKDEKYGLLNTSGKFIIDPKYLELVFIGNELLKALDENEHWGILNVKGEAILPFQYDAIGEFHENRAMIESGNKCGYANEHGEIVIPVKFPYTSILLTTGQFQNGYALLKQKYKSMLIDSSGKTISFPNCEDYGRPSQGLFPIKKNRKWGYSDTKGKIIIPCKFEFAESFENNFAVVRQNKMKGVIDTSGTIFIQPLYEDVAFKNKSILIRSNHKSGLLKNDGLLLIPCQYDKIEFVYPAIAKASEGKEFVYVNISSGRIIYNSNRSN
jgi:hypothetical protein